MDHQVPGRRLAAAHAVEELADAYAPHPRAHVALAPEGAGLPPDGHERVLDRFLDQAGVGAPAGEPQVQPGKVSSVQLIEGPPVAVGDRRQQLRITQVTASAGHIFTVSAGPPNGSSRSTGTSNKQVSPQHQVRRIEIGGVDPDPFEEVQSPRPVVP